MVPKVGLVNQFDDVEGNDGNGFKYDYSEGEDSTNSYFSPKFELEDITERGKHAMVGNRNGN